MATHTPTGTGTAMSRAHALPADPTDPGQTDTTAATTDTETAMSIAAKKKRRQLGR